MVKATVTFGLLLAVEVHSKTTDRTFKQGSLGAGLLLGTVLDV